MISLSWFLSLPKRSCRRQYSILFNFLYFFYLYICLAAEHRHWQDLGYLIIYVTGRPDMQKQRVVAWLSQHNFPHGIVSFCDGLVHDPLRHKANFLKSLTEVTVSRGKDALLYFLFFWKTQKTIYKVNSKITSFIWLTVSSCAQPIPGSHEAFRCLRLNQRYLSLHVYWAASFPDLHCGETLQEDAAPVPGIVWHTPAVKLILFGDLGATFLVLTNFLFRQMYPEYILFMWTFF